MSDNSLPYLADIAITKLIANADLTVDFTVSWNVASIRPDLIQIYTQFGSDSQLTDLGSLRTTIYADRSPCRVAVSGSDNDTFLYIGVAPRKVDPADGSCSDSMEDSSGEMQPWDSFMWANGFQIKFPPNSQGGRLPPPNIGVSSSLKTLTSDDRLNVTVYATIPPPVDQYQIRWDLNGNYQGQINSKDPWFSIPSVPGGVYAVKAQQRGVNFDGDPWSAWCSPVTYVASQRARSLRVFLNNSGVLRSGVTVRQYAQNDKGSTRSMMGL
jgi:hypothetical protein